MKKITIFLLVLILSATMFGQETNPTPSLTKQDYLKKSKNQKKAAWILLGGGAALVITGAAIPNEVTDYGPIFLSTRDDEYSNNWYRLIGVGALAMLGSIPLFIASGKNKRKAMSLSLYMQKAPLLQNSKIVNQSVPSINLKLSL